MLITELYDGAGLGNQLWCYAVTRSLARDNDYPFCIQGKEKFKGKHFMFLDYGVPEDNPEIVYHLTEELVRNNKGIDVSPPDSKFFSIPKVNTKLYGNMQAVSYIKNRKDEISAWLRPHWEVGEFSEYSKDNSCVIHLRGGDYVNSPANSLLPRDYYINAMNYMKSLGVDTFYVVTDDLHLASSYFYDIASIIGSTPSGVPDPLKSKHHIGGDISIDYTILNRAQNVIMSNSTFAWWATWTNTKVKNVIYPKGWFAFNHPEDYWSTADMYTPGWRWLDRKGNLE